MNEINMEWFHARTFALTGISNAEPGVHKNGEHASTFSFTLDGITYQAVEDPNDGHRSNLEHILEVGRTTLPVTFEPVKVIGEYVENSSNKVVRFVSQADGKTLLEIGTHNTDDYYPSFVADWRPENLPDNSPGEIVKREARQRELEEEVRRRDMDDWGSFA